MSANIYIKAYSYYCNTLWLKNLNIPAHFRKVTKRGWFSNTCCHAHIVCKAGSWNTW